MDKDYNDFSFERNDAEDDTYGEEPIEKEVELADEELFNTVDKVAYGLEAGTAEYDAYVDTIDLTYYGLGWCPSSQTFSEEGYNTLKTALQSDMATIAKAYAQNVHHYAIEYDLSANAVEKLIKDVEKQIAKDVQDAKGDSDAQSAIAVEWQHGSPSYLVQCTMKVPIRLMKGAVQLNECYAQHMTPFQN